MLDEAIAQLRTLNEPVPKPMRLPTLAEVEAIESMLGVRFHTDFRTYLLEASDVVFGTKEPATITRPESHTDLRKICDSAWNHYGVPKDLLPFCEDNADFFCLTADGEVRYWSHNGWSPEKWPNLATWIKQAWIDESI